MIRILFPGRKKKTSLFYEQLLCQLTNKNKSDYLNLKGGINATDGDIPVLGVSDGGKDTKIMDHN
jgi:hypothetical protein